MILQDLHYAWTDGTWRSE